uniref:Nucleotide-diphospho-sugar transferase n=1 Tax=Pithovirus LCPAC406 TaxID=2506599 RepID=A0A481ZDG4_9VIRU|nr:MAG: nucleotide-diphospho-sugar transferase [Pithovirus LCPAC406]
MDKLLVPSSIEWTRGQDIVLLIGYECKYLEHYDVIEFKPTKVNVRESLRTYVKLLNPFVIISKGDEYKDIESCSYLKWYRGLFILLRSSPNAIHSNMRICVDSITNTNLSIKEMTLLNVLDIKPHICVKELNKYKCVLKSSLTDYPNVILRDSIVPEDIPTVYIKCNGESTEHALSVLDTGNYLSKHIELDNLRLVLCNLEIFDQFFITYQIMVDTKLIHESIPCIITTTRRIEILRHLKDMTNRILSPDDRILSGLSLRSPKKHLIIQYYESKTRKNEIDECLIRNLSNPQIDRVHVLTEKIIDVPGDNTKKIVTNVGSRMTWKIIMKYIHDIARASIHQNDICIVANSDIYFDDTLSKIGFLNGTMFSLLRYDEGCLFGTDKKANMYHPAVIHGSSQDVWIFEPPELRGNLDFFCGGESLCDSKINYIFQDSGYMVLNPSYEIRCHHLHKSSDRKYGRSMLKGPFKVVPPTTLGSITPCTNASIVITYCTEGYTKYTINLFKSMNNIVAVCPDEKTSSILTKEGITTKVLYPLTGFQTKKQENWKTDGFKMLTIEKLRSIYHYLSYGYTVIYMDSDIVRLKDFENGLIDELHDCDILFQNDAEHDKDRGELCTGLVCVKPCKKTLKLFDPRYMFDVKSFRDDQSYLNRRIGYIKSDDPVVSVVYKVLKRDMYPNGSVFLSNPSLKETAMIVHMNHVKGEEKWKNLEKYNLLF